MSDEPTRRIPPAADPTQIQRPSTRPGARPDAPTSYAATQRIDAVQAGQAAQASGHPNWATAHDDPHDEAYGDPTQVMPPAGAAPPQRDYRSTAPPPAQPFRPYGAGQPTQAQAPGPFPGGTGYDQYPGYDRTAQNQPPGPQPSPFDQGYPPQPAPVTPAGTSAERGRGRDREPGGGSMAGAVLAWLPRLLLTLGVYQLVRLVPGFDVMPDVSQFPLFRGIGDGVLAMLNLDPEWSDQAANLTIPVLGVALAGLFNTIRSLNTSLAVWPHVLVIVAWIVVFTVTGIVGYAQDATDDVRQNVEDTVDQRIEDAEQNAKESIENEVEQGVEDARQNATDNIEQGITEQLEDALPGGNG